MICKIPICDPQEFATHRLRIVGVEDQVTVTGTNYMLGLQHRQEVSSPNSRAHHRRNLGLSHDCFDYQALK